MISIQDRINFYLGDFQYESDEPPMSEPVRHDLPFKSSQNYSELKTTYCLDINRYVKYTDKSFWLQCGDSPYTFPYPALVKIRDTANPKSCGIIGNLNSSRHWKPCERALKNTTKWSEKKNNAIWRGSTTGINFKFKEYNRELFVKDYCNKYDIGFSATVQSQDHLKEYIKTPIDIDGMLKYKYLPVIDGNDKSSSLNWILASSSVPIMPKPRFHSWLCESYLQPNVHYVEVQNNFSDFDEKIQWCKDNDSQCKQIAENGQTFILENFTNRGATEQIEKYIIEYLVRGTK